MTSSIIGREVEISIGLNAVAPLNLQEFASRLHNFENMSNGGEGFHDGNLTSNFGNH